MTATIARWVLVQNARRPGHSADYEPSEGELLARVGSRAELVGAANYVGYCSCLACCAQWRVSFADTDPRLRWLRRRPSDADLERLGPCSIVDVQVAPMNAAINLRNGAPLNG